MTSSSSNNIVIGHDAGLAFSSASQILAIGYQAAQSEDGHGPILAIGYQSLKNSDAGAANYNTAVGHSTGTSVSTGRFNTLVGYAAGDVISTGGENTIIGYNADPSANGTSNEIVIGATAAGLGANQTVIGHSDTTKTNLYGAVNSIYKTGTAAGSGIDAVSPTISVAEYNSEVITTIFIDLAAVGAIVSSGDTGDVIGESGGANAYLTQITSAINGIVYAGEIICLEVPTTGDPDINVAANSSGTIAEDAGGESQHVLANCGVHTLALRTEFTIPSGGIQDDFIYLTHGGTTAGGYDAGKFLLRFFGAKDSGL